MERCRGGWARSVRRALGASVLAGARAVAAALGTRRKRCVSAHVRGVTVPRGRKTLNFAKPSSRFIHKTRVPGYRIIVQKFLPLQLLPLTSPPHEKKHSAASQRAEHRALPGRSGRPRVEHRA